MLNIKQYIDELKKHYKLVVMNADTFEEVLSFKLSRLHLYIAACSIFIVIFIFTIWLVLYTPLKYYLQDKNNNDIGKSYQQLKYEVDSLEKKVIIQTKYINGIKVMLGGQESQKLDTATLEIGPAEVLSN